MYRRHLFAAALATALVGCSQAPPQEVTSTPDADPSVSAPEESVSVSTPELDVKTVVFKVAGMA